ncbi:MAG: hypothetical protein UT32_C0008G0001 [Parcubacteria group bacterium GW2011_GWC2_39_14]|nr:MAG: hypothetical protein UT32_C0008G0001 [Parcubacteria group bacterium GW2011_GWC2_39_14]KKR54934.1 MAG: hypothetical protein UT91_C0007G0035 [Parcubacteria group bacterium GW2011_GWA2_40_23]
MAFNHINYFRRSTRLPGYNYARPGMYFVTICTHKKEMLFGEIKSNQIVLSDLGDNVEYYWKEIPKHFPNTTLQEYVVMPNHFHGIIVISATLTADVGVQNFEPLHRLIPHNAFQKIIPKSIGSIVRGFKIGVTKWSRNNGKNYIVWQRNFYEHIIRNEIELLNIKKYIINNPQEWANDPEKQAHDQRGRGSKF